jgi:hypothetical protein
MALIDRWRRLLETIKATGRELVGFLTRPGGDVSKQSPEERKESYDNRVHLTTWTGVGLAALIALASGDWTLLTDAPQILKVLVVTLIVLGGACLAFARVGFEKASRDMRKLSKLGAKESSEKDLSLPEWPARPELMWTLSLLLALAAGACYLVASWWTVFASDSNHDQPAATSLPARPQPDRTAPPQTAVERWRRTG